MVTHALVESREGEQVEIWQVRRSSGPVRDLLRTRLLKTDDRVGDDEVLVGPRDRQAAIRSVEYSAADQVIRAIETSGNPEDAIPATSYLHDYRILVESCDFVVAQRESADQDERWECRLENGQPIAVIIWGGSAADPEVTIERPPLPDDVLPAKIVLTRVEDEDRLWDLVQVYPAAKVVGQVWRP